MNSTGWWPHAIAFRAPPEGMGQGVKPGLRRGMRHLLRVAAPLWEEYLNPCLARGHMNYIHTAFFLLKIPEVSIKCLDKS